MEKFKQFLHKTKDFLDKYWKVIVVCIGVILLMGQCSSCNRDNRAEKNQELIDSLRLENTHLNDRLNDSKSHNDNFTNIATGNQTVLINKIDSLKTVITKQKTEISDLRGNVRALQTLNNELTISNESLRQDNIKLNDEVVDLMSKLNK